ncbi:unnamed protein product, partial [Closterium sp. NIES-65]
MRRLRSFFEAPQKFLHLATAMRYPSSTYLATYLRKLPLAVTALLVSTAIVLLLSSTPSQHGIPTLDLPRVQASTAVQTSAPVQTDAPEPSDLHRAASDAGALTELQSRRSPHPDSIKPTYPNQDEPEDSETDPWLESLGELGGWGGVQWVEPVGDEPQSEIEAIWAAHAAKHMTFGKVQQPRRPAEAREEVREEALEEAGDKPEATSAPSAEPSPQSPSTPRAKIIVRTKTWGTWWAAADGVNWEGRVGRVYSTPSASQALTIIRVSDTEFQFLTPSNTFLTKAPSMFLETTTNSSDPLTVFTIEYIPDTVYVFQFLTPSNTFLTKAPSMFLETTTNSSDPLTVFTIEYIPDTVYIVFKSSDGWYISQNGESGPQFWWQGEPGDWERLDVREIMWVPAIRGANLGSWLMTEPWMNREVFKFAGYGDGTR